MSRITAKKEYPDDYPSEAVRILKAMSLSDGKHTTIVGSQSLRSQKYAGDYDADEKINLRFKRKEDALSHLVSEFQNVIKRLEGMKEVYIGDIKAGIVPEWDIFRSKNKVGRLRKLESLYSQKIISLEEYEAGKLLLDSTSKVSLLKAKSALRFQIIRWTPEEVLQGYTYLRNGKTMTLGEAFNTPSRVKLDCIGIVKGDYTEFSMIYFFFNNDRPINKDDFDIEGSLRDSIESLKAENNHFKVLKRKFVLAKLFDDKEELEKLNKTLNSPLGKIYKLYTDVSTLASLLESHSIPPDRIRYALGRFKERLRKLYKQDRFLGKQQVLLKDLKSASDSSSLQYSLKVLQYVSQQLSEALSKATLDYTGGGLNGIMPYLSYHMAGR